jgi:hypothetical protein
MIDTSAARLEGLLRKPASVGRRSGTRAAPAGATAVGWKPTSTRPLDMVATLRLELPVRRRRPAPPPPRTPETPHEVAHEVPQKGTTNASPSLGRRVLEAATIVITMLGFFVALLFV